MNYDNINYDKVMNYDKITNYDVYFNILNVTRDATLNDIKKAYRLLSIKHHPDKNGNSSSELFNKINDAYSILIRNYDNIKLCEKKQVNDLVNSSANSSANASCANVSANATISVSRTTTNPSSISLLAQVSYPTIAFTHDA
jgi:DnaJ-class molecular chaperone